MYQNGWQEGGGREMSKSPASGPRKKRTRARGSSFTAEWREWREWRAAVDRVGGMGTQNSSRVEGWEYPPTVGSWSMGQLGGL